MSNEFRGTGNVGETPSLKTVMVGKDNRKVTDMRVFFDEYRSDGQDGFERTGGFWLDVNVWGDKRAADVAQHVKKGTRVHVIGHLVESTWTATDSGAERHALHLDADELFVSLTRVSQISYAPRRAAPPAGD
jgi:single-strand DNA-binding protein